MLPRDCRFRADCRLCGGGDLQRVIELTPTPPGNHFLSQAELGRAEPVYPLEIYVCGSCHHVQLGHVVDPEVLYQQNYSYVSATSPVFVKHLEDYAAHVGKLLALPRGALVADIGSNDGTCLRFFQQAGHRVVGVDPAANIAEQATASGVFTVADFFGAKLGKALRQEHGPAALITSHNACAHIDDLAGVVEGVSAWLADDGYFVMEVGYFVDVFQNTWFDTIYHEHLDYHTVAPLVPFFAQHGLTVVRVERVSPQGGSIRVFCQKRADAPAHDDSVQRLIALEHELGLDRAETLRRFADKINGVRDELTQMVSELVAGGATIAGYGAPTKATTLLSHFRLGDVLTFIAEDNPLKQGLYSPLHHIPVISAEQLYERRPSHLLILAWNFAPSIMTKHERYRAEGGTFIVPMPSPQLMG